MIEMKKEQACGCLIASAVISTEVAKRKTVLELQKLQKKMAAVSDRKKISLLKGRKRELLQSLHQLHRHNTLMKNRFADYVRQSGYLRQRS